MSALLKRMLLLAALVVPAPGFAHDAPDHAERLPVIGAAPDFVLTSQDNRPVALADYRGKVIAVTFIYTSCADTCPLLTAFMVHVQEELGSAFGKKIDFVSITVDPERDTPEILRQYAENFDADLAGWAFLTGEPAVVRDVMQRFGVFAKKTATGDIDHTFLTSLIDANGNMRVQYLGVGFDLGEFRGDLLSLSNESD